MSLFGPPDIKKLESERDVKGLIKALTYKKEEDIRRKAADALADLGDKLAVEPLISALLDSSFFVRRSACEALGKIGDRRAVQPLISRFYDNEESNLRCETISAIKAIGDPGSIEPLLQMLDYCEKNHVYSDVFSGIKDALIAMGNLSIAPIISYLDVTYGSYLDTMYKVLGGEIDLPKGMERYGAGIPVPEGMYYALSVLRELEWKPEGIEGIYYCIVFKEWETMGGIGEQSIQPLIALLSFYGAKKIAIFADYKEKEEHQKNLEGIIHAISQSGISAVEPLITAITENSDQVARYAAQALEKIHDPRAIESLIRALKHDHMLVRSAAASALGNIKDPIAKQPLIAALDDTEDTVLDSVSKALALLGGEDLLPPLIESLKKGNWSAARYLNDYYQWQPDNDEAGAAYWIAKFCIGFLFRGNLKKLAPPDEVSWKHCVTIGAPAIRPLTIALLDDDPKVRASAADTLDKIGWQPDNTQAGASYWIARNEFEKCLEIGKPSIDALRLFILNCKDRDEEFALKASDILQKINGEIDRKVIRKMEKLVEKTVKEKTNSIDESVTMYFGSSGQGHKVYEYGVFAIPGLLETFTGGQYPGLRSSAESALEQFGEKAIESLTFLLFDRNRIKEVRANAAYILGEIGNQQAIPALRSALSDKDKVVRECAQRAMEKILQSN